MLILKTNNAVAKQMDYNSGKTVHSLGVLFSEGRLTGPVCWGPDGRIQSTHRRHRRR